MQNGKGGGHAHPASNAVERMFVLAVVAAILQDLPITIWAMFNDLPTQSQKYIGFEAILPFYWLKIIKYALFACAVFLASMRISGTRRVVQNFFWLVVPITLGLLPAIFVGASDLPWPYLIAGMKAWSPVLAVIVGIAMKREGFHLLEKILDWAIFLNVSIAIIQQIHGMNVCPIAATGCINLLEGYRSTGTFSEPNTMATLAIARLVLMINSRPSFLILLVGFVLVTLSASRTSLFLYALLFSLFVASRETLGGRMGARVIFSAIVGIVGIFIYVRGMGGVLERGEIILRYLSGPQWLFGHGFGAGTLSMEALGHLNSQSKFSQFPADSLIASLLAQGGVWLLVWVAASLTWIMIGGAQRARAFVSIFALLGFGMVVSEVWPINIILVALIGNAIWEELPRFGPGAAQKYEPQENVASNIAH